MAAAPAADEAHPARVAQPCLFQPSYRVRDVLLQLRAARLQASDVERRAVAACAAERGLRHCVAAAGEEVGPGVQRRRAPASGAAVQQHHDRRRPGAGWRRQRHRQVEAVAGLVAHRATVRRPTPCRAWILIAQASQSAGRAVEQIEAATHSVRRRQHQPAAVRRHRRHRHEVAVLHGPGGLYGAPEIGIQPCERLPRQRMHEPDHAAVASGNCLGMHIPLRVRDDPPQRLQRRRVGKPHRGTVGARDTRFVVQLRVVRRKAQNARPGQLPFADPGRQVRDVETLKLSCRVRRHRRRPSAGLLNPPRVAELVPTGADADPSLAIGVPEHDAGLPADDARGRAVADMHPVDAAVRRRLSRRRHEDVVRVVGQWMQKRVFEVVVGEAWQGNAAAHLHRYRRRAVQQRERIAAVVVDRHQAHEAAAGIGQPAVRFREDVHRADDALVGHPLAGIEEFGARLHLQSDGDRAGSEVDGRQTALAVVRSDGEHSGTVRRNAHVIDRWHRPEDLGTGIGERHRAGKQSSEGNGASPRTARFVMPDHLTTFPLGRSLDQIMRRRRPRHMQTTYGRPTAPAPPGRRLDQ